MVIMSVRSGFFIVVFVIIKGFVVGINCNESCCGWTVFLKEVRELKVRPGISKVDASVFGAKRHETASRNPVMKESVRPLMVLAFLIKTGFIIQFEPG